MGTVALLGFSAYVQQRDARVFNVVHGFEVEPAHHGELEQLVSRTLDISTAVAHTADTAVDRRNNGAEDGADDAGNTADADRCRSDKRTGRAR